MEDEPITSLVQTPGQDYELEAAEEHSQKLAKRPKLDGTLEGESNAVSHFGHEFTEDLSVMKPPTNPLKELKMEPDDYVDIKFRGRGGGQTVKYLKAQGAFKMKVNHGIQVRTFITQNDTFKKVVYGVAAVYNGDLGGWVTTTGMMEWDGMLAIEKAKYDRDGFGVWKEIGASEFIRRKVEVMREGEFALRSIQTKLKRKLILELLGDPGALDPEEYQAMLDELEGAEKGGAQEKAQTREAVENIACINCKATFGYPVLAKTKGVCPQCKANPWVKVDPKPTQKSGKKQEEKPKEEEATAPAAPEPAPLAKKVKEPAKLDEGAIESIIGKVLEGGKQLEKSEIKSAAAKLGAKDEWLVEVATSRMHSHGTLLREGRKFFLAKPMGDVESTRKSAALALVAYMIKGDKSLTRPQINSFLEGQGALFEAPDIMETLIKLKALSNVDKQGEPGFYFNPDISFDDLSELL